MNPMSFLPAPLSPDELAAHQLAGLQWTVAHAYQGSPFYRTRLDSAGVAPAAVKSLDDLRRLPFTTADDLRDGYPFPLLATPLENVVRLHASSGTTGKRKVLTYTRKDLDDWAQMFARCYELAGVTREDRVQIAVGYGIWTAGSGFQAGCERLGALAVPAGPGFLDMQCQFLVDFGVTVLCSTSSMALLMAEEIRRRVLSEQVKINKLIYGSERTSEAMRQRISEALGAELFDIPGLTELYGPGTASSAGPRRHPLLGRLLYSGDSGTVSLRPGGAGAGGGDGGDHLCKEAAPLIRYRTRDLPLPPAARALPLRQPPAPATTASWGAATT